LKRSIASAPSRTLSSFTERRPWSFPAALLLYRKLSCALHTDDILLVRADGHRVYAAARDMHITDALAKSGSLHYEKLQTKLIRRALKPSMTVLDIGANVGYYSLMIARDLKGSGRIYAFEPEPFNFRLLKANININGYANITPIRQAVSDVDETVTLFKDFGNCGAHSLWSDNVGQISGVEHIPATTLDSFVRTIGTVDLIKMDIQGAEARAIRGGEHLLSEQHPILFFEIAPRLLQHAGDDTQAITELLQSWDYELRVIDEDEQKLESVDVAKLESRCKDLHYSVNVMAKCRQ